MQAMKFFTSKEVLDSQRKTLFFIHGAGGSHHTWDMQAPLEKKFNIITVDLPGHGYSTGDGLESIDEMVGVVHELVHQEFADLLPMVFIGHSMGGGVVQQYVLEHPQDVDALVLLDTGARLKVTELIFDYLAEDFSKAVDYIIKFAFHEGADERGVEKSREQMLKCPPDVMFKDFNACNSFDVFNEVNSIIKPTLIICGSADLLTPLKYSKYLQDNIYNSRFEEIEEAGHMTMLEKPDTVNRIIKQFIVAFSNEKVNSG
ncbi:MAG: alpha/beta fold hydrolase [Candidatus Odinarchaeota archaeon]